MATRTTKVLPGFGLSLGYATFYMSLLVLIPLSALAIKSGHLTWDQFRHTIQNPAVIQSFKLSFTAAAAAALLNGVFGTIAAWALVRYRFPGRKILDAVVDLPFAMPTAVAGLTFSDLFGQIPFLSINAESQEWIFPAWAWGLSGLGVQDWLRITFMLTFVGLPYVIRSIQPILQDWDMETEQAAMSLGANPPTIFRTLIVPEIFPGWLSGVALSFARGVGEYGSIIFIASNIPYKSQIAPQLIIDFIYDPIDAETKMAQATSLGLVMLLLSLTILLLINGIEWFARRHKQ